MKHSEVYADHEFLWSIGEADDMTGGYVDQDDLDRLLKTPTKKVAKECLINQMGHWFDVGIERSSRWENGKTQPHEFEEEYPRIREIAEKYGFDFKSTMEGKK